MTIPNTPEEHGPIEPDVNAMCVLSPPPQQ